MKIAVYTIAKNEEQFIDKWYESAKEADHLLIADTGSTDGTVEKARSLGINVPEITVNPWRFDNARNASLALIPSDIDYCIALDMDEILIPGWREELAKVFAAGATRPRYKYTWSWNADGSPGLQYGGDKIHSRNGYRWKHPVHEVIVADRIMEKQVWCDLEIHHYPDKTKPRSQYLPLLQLATAEDPHDDRNAHYYARELFFVGAHKEAIKEFKRHLDLPSATWKAERAASYRYLAKCDPENAEKYLTDAASEDPTRREPKVELASFYYQKNDWDKCYRTSLDALKIKEKPLDYLCEEFAWGALPYDLASIAAWNLKKIPQAIKYAKAALKYGENKRIENNLAHYQKALDNQKS